MLARRRLSTAPVVSFAERKLFDINLANMKRAMGNHQAFQGRIPETSERLEKLYAEAIDQNQSAVGDDRRGRSHLAQAAFVLASYRSVLPWLGNNSHAAIEMIRQPLGDGASKLQELLIQWRLLFSRDVLETGAAALRSMEIDWGSSWEVDHVTERSAEGQLQAATSTVKRCFYADFFKRNGTPELTYLFCAWDRAYFDSIPAKYNVRFDRPKTIADGDDVCLFKLRREVK